MSNPNWVSLTETCELTPTSSIRPKTRRYSRTSDSASALDVVLSPKWSKVAVMPARLSSRIAAIASSMFSPAMKRRVTWPNPGSFEKKSFSSVFCERYKSAALYIMPGSVIRKLSFQIRTGQAGTLPAPPTRTLSHDLKSSSTDGQTWKSGAIIIPVNIPERKTTAGYDDGYTTGDCPDTLSGWRVLFDLRVRHEIQTAQPRSKAHHRARFCGSHSRDRGSLAGGRPFSGDQSERGQLVHRVGNCGLLPGGESAL